ncbi:hypothetical protein [Kaistia adipata]|uniref:hypothetical protein n=1 Tax=Kaistia adipata TaxID=166954 RepID=UPI000426A0B9|nr:hypothetical protein [Kaistia adipata]
MKVWAFHGMRRSGNHVVLNWTGLSAFPLFLNDIRRADQSARLLGDPVPPPGFWSWLLRQCARKRIRKLLLRDGGKLFSGGLCVSLEDWSIEDPIFDPWPANIRHILLIRDPLNMFASRIRMTEGLHNVGGAEGEALYFRNSISLWKSHAREFLGDTRHLPEHVGIYYDSWLTDLAYRADIAARLGLVPDEAALEIVPPHGGGSSFEGMAPLGADAVERRLSRHSQLSEGEQVLFARILCDPELLALRARVLAQVGMTDGLQAA